MTWGGSITSQLVAGERGQFEEFVAVLIERQSRERVSPRCRWHSGWVPDDSSEIRPLRGRRGRLRERAREGWEFKRRPSGAKAHVDFGACGTTKVVPFQSNRRSFDFAALRSGRQAIHT